MRKLVPTGLALALALAARAQPHVVSSFAPPLVVPAGAYRLDPSRTRVAFAVARFPFGPFQGRFLGASGVLLFDPKDLAASRLEVKIPIAGCETDSHEFTINLRGRGWFDAARFPFMTFRSRTVAATGADTADVLGDLTLHGVTRPMVLKAKFTSLGANPLDKAAQPGFEVRGVIKRREFGVTRFEPFVSDDVRITITATFQRAGT